jgi:hypothetical protein
MAAKGTLAKENVAGILKNVFGTDYIGEVDKKIYVWANDGGEKVQIAISLTCPKVPIGEKKASAFEEMPESPKEKTEISDEERNNIATMLARLGL